MFPAVFNLADLNGQNGFIINGIYQGDQSGTSVATSGDVNGDGVADIIIGAQYAKNNAGQSYIVFGSKRGFVSPFDLDNLNGKNGFTINAVNDNYPGDYSGWSVSGAGDINDDGIADVIIGLGNTYARQSYVVFGSKSGFPAQFNLASLNGQNGFVIYGISVGQVATAGDVNGDGIADIIIGAPGANSYAGQSYVIFGSKSGFTTPFDLTDLNGKNGFAINGINPYDYSGGNAATAGDVNNDGTADIIIGAHGAYNNVGQSYVVFGSKIGFPASFDLSNLNGQNGFVINGVSYMEEGVGLYVGTAGDINDDGIADVIISSFHYCYVVFGSGSGFVSPFNLDNLDGKNGFTIHYKNGDDFSCGPVATAGDVNNDGIADVIINGEGLSYVVFGSRNEFNTTFLLSNLNGQNGFAINPIDANAESVATAGDVNNDGIADIIMGAPNALSNAGQSYVIFGMGSPVPRASSSATQTPTPTSSLSFGASPSNTPEPTPSHNNAGDNHELSVGAIAGIAVGAAAGVALLSGGIAWYGKAHGWWCVGEHSDGYVGVDSGVN